MRYEWLDAYLLSKKGANKDYKVEWGWNRYLIKDKMFGAICTDKNDKPIVTLKCKPDDGMILRNQFKDITPGYYMNKEHWNSVFLEGDVPDDVLRSMIDQSYDLVLGSMSKKTQKVILDSGQSLKEGEAL